LIGEKNDDNFSLPANRMNFSIGKPLKLYKDAHKNIMYDTKCSSVLLNISADELGIK